MRKIILPIFILAIFLTAVIAQSNSQNHYQNRPITNFDEPLIDEWGRISTDDEMSRLDNLAVILQKQPDSQATIISYNHSDRLPGQFLRKILGYKQYLVNNRGIDKDFVNIVADTISNKGISQFWITPRSTVSNPSFINITLPKNLPLKFDEIPLGNGCLPEFTIDLYELKDALKVYADALQKTPNSKASIVIYPNKRTRLNHSARIATDAKNTLIKQHNIKADRIEAKVGNRRYKCAKAELWIMPASDVAK